MTKGRGKNAPDRSAELLDRNAAEMAPIAAAALGGSLPPKAAELLQTIVASDTAMRIIKPEDLPLLELYCMQYQVYCDAKAAYLSQPAATRTREETVSGGLKRNSDIDVMAKAGERMVQLARQIGLTPIARAQLNLTNTAAASLMAANFGDRVAAMFDAAKGGR